MSNKNEDDSETGHTSRATMQTDELKSTVGNIPESEPVKPQILKPRVDKNYQRVMDLEKEVLELYKMLDYWKNEAKSL